MANINSTNAALIAAAVSVLAIGTMVRLEPNALAPNALAGPATPAGAASAEEAKKAADPVWAASATGRVEPRSGEVRIVAPVGGIIAAVLVEANDRMIEGDLMVRLDDGDQLARIAAARAETLVRRRERDEETKKPTGLVLDRRNAEDAVEDAEHDLFEARQRFDSLFAQRKAGTIATEVVNLRQEVVQKRSVLDEARRQLARVEEKEGIALPERLEAALTQARSDLRLAYQSLERTRIRAPSDGTVLRVDSREGELAAPSPEVALLTFGDLTTLKVRAEVEDRDVARIQLGQRAVVRADAFPGQDFTGKVTSIASSLGSPQIVSRGPRRPNDVDVLEVIVTLDNGQPLVTRMRVDVFFANRETAMESKPQ
ncbi:MAG: HlyD family secretion protein [Hyphomicrobiaceae bacterium]